MDPAIRNTLQRGVVIPASPLALDAQRKLDERRQRAVWRYYSAAGAGGIAVGVHTTQFGIRHPAVGLFEPLLSLARDECDRLDENRGEPLVRIAGICGQTDQAVHEAGLASERGFHAGLVSLADMRDADDDGLLEHCRAVGEVIPLMAFYLQPAVGGRVLAYRFWKRLAEIESLVAVKVAPFNRYQTFDVVRAMATAGREDVALYTGNDDNIIVDLLSPHRITIGNRVVEARFVGGLLGHWAVWTKRAVELLDECHLIAAAGGPIPRKMMRLNVEVTDANAALFDAANSFAGCIPGVHEVLRRQGLLDGNWCLNPDETLSPNQSEEIDRIYRMYPHLVDDDFIAAHRDEWLR
jgi:dihydrodipicolinate synthase/N-acetylneuraminate lyase